MREKIKQILSFIFMFIGGIWVIIQIFTWVTASKIDISATIDVNDYKIPSEFASQFSHENIRLNTDSIFVIFQHESSVKLPEKTKYLLNNLLDTKFYERNFYTPTLICDKFCILKIANSGDKEIQDIQVSNINAYYEFSNTDRLFLHGYSEGKIKVGNLRPTEEITLFLWVSKIDEDKVRITYPEGVISPDKYIKVSGFIGKLAWMQRVFGFSGILFILLIIYLIGTFIYLGIQYDKFKKKSKLS